jgi:hypothetical protein
MAPLAPFRPAPESSEGCRCAADDEGCEAETRLHPRGHSASDLKSGLLQ